MTTSSEAQFGDVTIDRTLHTHVCTAATFNKIFIALLFLTVITVAASRVDFGPLNMFIALAIASCKAACVMAVFMHLRWDTPINNIAFLGSLLFLGLLFLFTIADFATRGDVDPVEKRRTEVQNQFKWQHADH